eukprot:CAMPEP_0183506378 /NCGR_PEP_ID=MMETSP0371-20130417/7399_1 /TAXON_ID=268820 /ORGANISM="Peridinium aciculiferum, Strain PAER-2" /LENGTH=211 /DNA_ID=CAMNT_0025702317 /DNA_START=331 /DNA_END=964 /DNA_ORIENTATION=+
MKRHCPCTAAKEVSDPQILMLGTDKSKIVYIWPATRHHPLELGRRSSSIRRTISGYPADRKSADVTSASFNSSMEKPASAKLQAVKPATFSSTALNSAAFKAEAVTPATKNSGAVKLSAFNSDALNPPAANSARENTFNSDATNPPCFNSATVKPASLSSNAVKSCALNRDGVKLTPASSNSNLWNEAFNNSAPEKQASTKLQAVKPATFS